MTISKNTLAGMAAYSWPGTRDQLLSDGRLLWRRNKIVISLANRDVQS
jgi:hypothetical protein